MRTPLEGGNDLALVLPWAAGGGGACCDNHGGPEGAAVGGYQSAILSAEGSPGEMFEQDLCMEATALQIEFCWFAYRAASDSQQRT